MSKTSPTDERITQVAEQALRSYLVRCHRTVSDGMPDGSDGFTGGSALPAVPGAVCRPAGLTASGGCLTIGLSGGYGVTAPPAEATSVSVKLTQ
jgi:hypothetical protein